MRAKYNHVYFTMKIICLCASRKVNLERQGREEVGLELLIHLSLYLLSVDYRDDLPHIIYTALRIEPMALWMLSKHSSNPATFSSSAPSFWVQLRSPCLFLFSSETKGMSHHFLNRPKWKGGSKKGKILILTGRAPISIQTIEYVFCLLAKLGDCLLTGLSRGTCWLSKQDY